MKYMLLVCDDEKALSSEDREVCLEVGKRLYHELRAKRRLFGDSPLYPVVSATRGFGETFEIKKDSTLTENTRESSSLISWYKNLERDSFRASSLDENAPTFSAASRIGAGDDPLFGLLPGSMLGRYQLIDSIGSGGMGAVVKAIDTDLGRVVALKILPPHMARHPENIARFRQEARSAARLDHENIARAFAFGEDRGLYFIAFEFVEGINLQTLIDRLGVIPPVEAVNQMIQVAAGLAHAEERGVVHRDIKPSNIMITPDGRAKIVDMGLARCFGESVDGGVTRSGVTLGTFDYISPEQALDPRRADARSDIYSLGCTFYHALTGRSPMPEGTAAVKLNAHQNGAITDPRLINPAISNDLCGVLLKMTAKDPERRFQSPIELIAALFETNVHFLSSDSI